MFNLQIKSLTSQADNLMAQAQDISRPGDKLKLIESAKMLYREVRIIVRENQQNSLAIYLEYCSILRKTVTYKKYLEFSLRNGLVSLSEQDYTELSEHLASALLNPSSEALRIQG